MEVAVDLLAGPAFYRRFIAHQPFHSDYAAASVDAVLAAVGGMPAQGPSAGLRAGPGDGS